MTRWMKSSILVVALVALATLTTEAEAGKKGPRKKGPPKGKRPSREEILEMFDEDGKSIFGKIDQVTKQYHPPR